MAPRLLLAGLACLAAAGCGGGAAGKEAPEPKLGAKAQKAIDELDAASNQPRDEAGRFDELLREREVALEREDVYALVSTALGAQRARDRRSARRAKRLAIERIRFVAHDLKISGDRAEAKVVMSYRVRGMSRPFITERKLVARDNGSWRAVRDEPLDEPLPWEVDDFAVARSPHVVLFHPRELDPGPLQAGLEDAYREIERNLPRRDLPRSVLVLAARDDAQAERLTGRIARGVIALANVLVDFGPRPAFEVERVLSQRLIVIDSRWSTQPELERRGTLVHEMTHTAMNPDTSGRTPPWLVEGMAMYVSGDDRSPEALARAAGVAPAIRLARLCKPNSIFRLRGSVQGAAYAASSAAAHAIVAEHGNKGLFKLHDAFNDSRIPGRPGARTTDRVLRRTLGMSLAELDAAVAGG